MMNLIESSIDEFGVDQLGTVAQYVDEASNLLYELRYCVNDGATALQPGMTLMGTANGPKTHAVSNDGTKPLLGVVTSKLSRNVAQNERFCAIICGPAKVQSDGTTGAVNTLSSVKANGRAGSYSEAAQSLLVGLLLEARTDTAGALHTICIEKK